MYYAVEMKTCFAKSINACGGRIFFGGKPEQQVMSRFLDAVMYNPDDAWTFVSKIYSPKLNLDELREILTESAKLKISKAIYMHEGKKFLTRSVYVENTKINMKKLLHLQLIKDGGAWKIYSVEQEECTKL